MTVIAREVGSGDIRAKVRTDLSGRFDLGGMPPGSYDVCWEADGFLGGCYDGPVTLTDQPVHLSTILISTAVNRPNVSLAGYVRLADGSSARRLHPAEGVNAFAQVEVLDANGNVIGQAPVNNFDRYFLPVVPGDRAIMLRAAIEGATLEFPIEPEAELFKSRLHRIDLSLRNHPPQLGALVATQAGARKRAFAPGDVVTLTATSRDRDGDSVAVRWKAEAGSVDDPNATTVKWTLPAAPGRYGIEVVAADGNGGHDAASLDVDANGKGVRFAGLVSGTDAPSIGGAMVDVNGSTATTDGSGYFELYAADADRFVLTIRKTGYAFVSRIYDGPVRAGRWQLLKATQFPVNVDGPIDVTVTERPPSQCRGRASDRIDWRRFQALVQDPVFQDGKGRRVPAFAKDERRGLGVWLPEINRDQGKRECGPGPRVQIPAGALVDPSGSAATGNATLSIATVDLNTPEQMPARLHRRRRRRQHRRHAQLRCNLRQRGTGRQRAESGTRAAGHAHGAGRPDAARRTGTGSRQRPHSALRRNARGVGADGRQHADRRRLRGQRRSLLGDQHGSGEERSGLCACAQRRHRR